MNPTHPGAAEWKRHPLQALEHPGPVSSTQQPQSSCMCFPHCGSASKIRTKMLLYPVFPASSLVFSTQEAINTCRRKNKFPQSGMSHYSSPRFSLHTPCTFLYIKILPSSKATSSLKQYLLLPHVTTLGRSFF